MEPHNKIINDVAKRILKPEGLFRVGSTRTWIEDNGYFFTMVAFESSGYTKGSYLMVGINFMWGCADDTDEYWGVDIGGREIVGRGTQFVEYRPNIKNCDSIFEQGITDFANAALLKVREYRKYRNLEYAKEMLKSIVDTTPPEQQCWELYRLALLCFFKGDYEEGREYFDKYLEHTKNSFFKTVSVTQGGVQKMQTVHIEWLETFYNHCIDTIIPQIGDPESARRMVYDKINRRRSLFSGKKSYKGMKTDIVY